MTRVTRDGNHVHVYLGGAKTRDADELPFAERNRIINEGVKAREEKRPNNNPYKAGTQAAKLWDVGYRGPLKKETDGAKTRDAATETYKGYTIKQGQGDIFAICKGADSEGRPKVVATVSSMAAAKQKIDAMMSTKDARPMQRSGVINILGPINGTKEWVAGSEAPLSLVKGDDGHRYYVKRDQDGLIYEIEVEDGATVDTLVSGSSRAAISNNVETEMAAGKPQAQAVAIALQKAGLSNKDIATVAKTKDRAAKWPKLSGLFRDMTPRDWEGVEKFVAEEKAEPEHRTGDANLFEEDRTLERLSVRQLEQIFKNSGYGAKFLSAVYGGKSAGNQYIYNVTYDDPDSPGGKDNGRVYIWKENGKVKGDF